MFDQVTADELQALREEHVCTEEIFNGRILHVQNDTVRLPNGHTSTRELIRHVGAVCVIPVDEEGNTILERQFRYPLDSVITEIPAGKLDSREEDRLEAAQRELMEETGITAGRWTSLGDYYGAAAYTDEHITMYLAQDLHYGERRLDEDEFLNFYKVPLKEAVADVLSGNITDGKTQVAVLKAAALLGML